MNDNQYVLLITMLMLLIVVKGIALIYPSIDVTPFFIQIIMYLCVIACVLAFATVCLEMRE